MKQLFSCHPVSVLAMLVTLFLPAAVCALTVEINTAAQLQAEVSAANQRGGNTIILLNDGVYSLTTGLSLASPFITLQGKNHDRTKVIIEGDAMSPTASVGSLISVTASDCSLHHLTLRKCRWHLVQIHGENNADRISVKNCILNDSYEQMVKVTVDTNNTDISADNGLIENCLFEYSAGIGPQWYIGGIDAHSAKNWIVRNNTFKFISSPSDRISEFAIHFWNYSANNLVEKNLIINCDRGIGFGLQGRGNNGGIIRNNMIYHAAGNGAYADTGIALAESPDTKIYNNTVFLEHSFPWAIEYRFTTTRNILITNNLTNKPIQARDGATGSLSSNVTTAQANWFRSIQAADLHLASADITDVINKGEIITELTDDFDGTPRNSSDGGVDIGADEFSAVDPPENLQAE